MSARDSASGSSTYKGGSGGAGGLGNGGVGGGMGGGSRGGGAGYNGGAGSRTGLTTGNTTYGNTAFGRPGGNAVAYGMRDAASLGRAGMGPTVGSFGNFRTPSGAAMFGNSSVQGQSFRGMNMGQALSQANRAQARQPASVPGLLGGSPVAAGAPAYSAVDQEMALPTFEAPASVPNIFNQDYLGGIANFRNMINGRYGWNDQPVTAGPGPVASDEFQAGTRASSYINVTPEGWKPGMMRPTMSSPQPYDKAYSPGPGAISNQARPSTNNRGYGGWNTLGFN